MKTCSYCKVEKSIYSFSKNKNGYLGLQAYCKDCAKEKKKEHYIKNSEREKEYAKNWYRQNKTRSISVSMKYQKENSERIRDNKRKRAKERRANDPKYRAERGVRHRVWKAINRLGAKKGTSTFNIVGCSRCYLFKHLESQFSKGMTWDNYGEWHIDHIVPLSSAETYCEMIKLCHYTNLQPLWAKDNLSKGDKVDYCKNTAAP